jgi:biofilm PGA synthesis N-glycosyltransferase PgaC
MAMNYVLISPARNEESFISKTIDSVINQTIRPLRWIIIDDNSSDRTAEIVRDYAESYDFIQLISRDGTAERSFASKSKAVAYAYEALRPLDFDYVGNLDADIELLPDYYESILTKMEANPKLGLAGGIRYDYLNEKFVLRDCARNSVGGPIQLFRRECFERIGGYKALPYGGIDAVAETMARSYGWEVRSFPEIRVFHYRATGTAGRSIWNALFRAGLRDYSIGYHPLFELAHVAKNLFAKPYFGSLLTMAGYLSALIKREKRAVPKDLMEFLHREQLGRLIKLIPQRHPSRRVKGEANG